MFSSRAGRKAAEVRKVLGLGLSSAGSSGSVPLPCSLLAETCAPAATAVCNSTWKHRVGEGQECQGRWVDGQTSSSCLCFELSAVARDV